LLIDNTRMNFIFVYSSTVTWFGLGVWGLSWPHWLIVLFPWRQ